MPDLTLLLGQIRHTLLLKWILPGLRRWLRVPNSGAFGRRHWDTFTARACAQASINETKSLQIDQSASWSQLYVDYFSLKSTIMKAACSAPQPFSGWDEDALLYVVCNWIGQSLLCLCRQPTSRGTSRRTVDVDRQPG